MLPFFFQHYDPFVEKYYFFDNGSTDGSLDLLSKHPKVELGSFVIDGDSFVEAALQMYDHCWKVSRGQADWVYVCNVDEHLYHPNLAGYLRKCQRQGISVITPEGYQMVSEEFPRPGIRLCDQIQHGARFTMMDKPQLFSPTLIEEINFALGRHAAQPTGTIRVPQTTSLKLLHYKYIGINYLVERHTELRQGLRSRDLANGWGFQYCKNDEEKIATFRRFQAQAVHVTAAPSFPRRWATEIRATVVNTWNSFRATHV